MATRISALHHSIQPQAGPNCTPSVVLEKADCLDDRTQMPQLPTMKEASALLRCSRSHLSNAIHGKLNSTPLLPCVRIGRRVLFRLEELEKWVGQLQRVQRASTEMRCHDADEFARRYHFGLLPEPREMP